MSVRVEIEYVNWKGVRSSRQIHPQQMFYGVTEYHPEMQWLLDAFDFTKWERRTFAMKDIHSWVPVE